MNKIRFSAGILAVLMIIVSCGEVNDASKITKKNIPEILNLIPAENPDHVLSDYLNQQNWDDVTALVVVQQSYTNSSQGGNSYQGSENTAFARFYDDDLTDNVEIGSFAINNLGLVDIGNYSYQILGEDINNFVLNYGSGANLFRLYNLAGELILDTNITFTAPIILTNFNLLQNVSRTQNFPLTWSGSSLNTFVQISFISNDPNSPDSSSIYNGINFGYKPNTGSLTLESDALQNLRRGETIMIVNKDELNFLTCSDGKRICLMISSQYYTKVNIVD